MKRCIYHYTEEIADNPTAGSALRPNRMLNAFREMGYQVDQVTGYSGERKKKIEQVRQNIKNGVQYDFVYSESVNSPTLMSDPDNIPRHPFMDFAFLKFCRKNGIPVGLFYRDIYWKFPEIFNDVTTPLKRMILIPLFSYDLHKYKSCIDTIFLPTQRMHQYTGLNISHFPLPPGGEPRQEALTRRKNRTPMEDGILRIFYVGSISGLYDNRKLFQAVHDTPGVSLTFCTHSKQWEACKKDYEPWLCDRIHIIHKSGKELAQYYEQADVAAYCLNDNEYLDMAMPIKFFESISYGTPILATSVYSVSQFVEKEGIGWVAETSAEGIREKLEYLKLHPEELREKANNTVEAAYRNTWLDRARQAAQDLTNQKIGD